MDRAQILLGDYNFDYDIASSRRDRRFDLLTSEGIYKWLEPVRKIKTQCSSRYNSILDFFFVGGSALNWQAESTIEFQEEAYCRSGIDGSDHRPVLAQIQPCQLLEN